MSAFADAVLLRDAAPGDAEALSGLLGELGHPLEPALVTRQLERIAGFGSGYFVVVAVAEGRAIGASSGFATPVLHRAEPVGRLSVLVVARTHAGRGIGSLLLADAEARFRALGCERVELTSAAHRTEAHDFYRRRGYALQGVRFSRSLEGGAPR